jgi:hypothetical protein
VSFIAYISHLIDWLFRLRLYYPYQWLFWPTWFSSSFGIPFQRFLRISSSYSWRCVLAIWTFFFWFVFLLVLHLVVFIVLCWKWLQFTIANEFVLFVYTRSLYISDYVKWQSLSCFERRKLTWTATSFLPSITTDLNTIALLWLVLESKLLLPISWNNRKLIFRRGIGFYYLSCNYCPRCPRNKRTPGMKRCALVCCHIIYYCWLIIYYIICLKHVCDIVQWQKQHKSFVSIICILNKAVLNTLNVKNSQSKLLLLLLFWPQFVGKNSLNSHHWRILLLK